MADVFLSYKREDQRIAREVAADLEAEGFSVFFDVEIDIGDGWPERIETELNNAHAVVVLWSPRSCSIDAKWVKREARAAAKRDILCPSTIEECELPLEFSDLQSANLIGRNASDRAHLEWRRLCKTVGRHVGRAPRGIEAEQRLAANLQPIVVEPPPDAEAPLIAEPAPVRAPILRAPPATKLPTMLALGASIAHTAPPKRAGRTIVVGDTAAAVALALDCRKFGDRVHLVSAALPEESARLVRRKGVTTINGDPTQPVTLRAASITQATSIVAFEPDDTTNLQIEAAARRTMDDAKRSTTLDAHVATKSLMLLREALEMRMSQSRRHSNTPSPISPRPFSMDELAARALLQREVVFLLALARQLSQTRLHIVMFGFGNAAEAFARALLSSCWSVHLDAPRLTVLTPDPQATEMAFRARHREAFSHPQLWCADIAFQAFDWDASSLSDDVLTNVETSRGPPTAAMVATGSDALNIHLSLALKRSANLRWPIPIYMNESNQSEFGREYAKGRNTEQLEAYLQAFGSYQSTATRALIVDGALDVGSAMAHQHFLATPRRGQSSLDELKIQLKDWQQTPEHFRAANRGIADSVLVKMWDVDWRPAHDTESGRVSPDVPIRLIERLCRREHDRWVADRLMAGWRPARPGERRDYDLKVHDKLTPWDTLTDDDHEHCAEAIRMCVHIAQVLYPSGFVSTR